MNLQKDIVMYNTILVPTDGTSLSDKAIDGAIEYASLHKGCKIIGMTVAEFLSSNQLESFTKSLQSEYANHEHQVAQQRLDKITERAKAANVPCETFLCEASKPHEAIVKIAKEQNCDCIFMASNGRTGLNKLFLGSETQKVLATVSIPVLVYR